MKLLLAPWGNPTFWKELYYKFDRKEVRSRTSLKILQETIKPDKTLIVGLDTLAKIGSNYEEVKKDAERKIKEHVNEFGLEKCEVHIAPGIGSFPNGIFIGEALDYYYYTLAKISIHLLKCSDDILEIHFDLTHGINYSVILTYRAVKEILELFSIFKKVKFKAYNADPSLPTSTDKLFINVIEDIEPSPKPFDEKINQGRTLEPKDLDPEDRRKLFKEDLSCTKEVSKSEISAFLGALYNGCPLAIFRFYPDKDKLDKIIHQTLHTYAKYVNLENRDKLTVKRNVRFGKDFKVYLFAYLTVSLLEKSNLLDTNKKEVNISELKNLTSNLFKFDERFKTRIEKDIHSLKKDLDDKDIRDWKIYNEVLERSVGEPDSRNFLAHSGFERNIVEVKKSSPDVVFIRYREEKIGTIKDLCQKGLR
ncbi:CRISPR-associated CARF protein Csx1 [Desulfothermus sp.]